MDKGIESDSIEFGLLVTIITPVLNGVQYIEECLKSSLKQDYPHIEHLFIDGASTDGTVGILSDYSSRYPGRIRFISEPDSGGTEAVNKGIMLSKGEILQFMGSDDMCEPGAISAVVGFSRANPGAHLVYGDSNLIDEKGEIVGLFRTREYNLKDAISGAIFPAGTSTFYSRELFDRIGMFTELVNDLDIFIRAGKSFPVYRIDKVLSNFRIHKGSLTTGSWERRKRQFRDARIVSLRHGGGIFSTYSMIHYAYVLLDWFRPVFGPIYPFIGKVTGKNIGKTKDDWAIRRKS